MLACAIENRVDYCPRDCDRFPCDQFKAGPYPFSQGYLNMQERRRRERPTAKIPCGDVPKVPSEYWEDLKRRDLNVLCGNALARTYPPDGIRLSFLGKELLIDRKHRRLFRLSGGHWDDIDAPLLELLCLVYLLNVGPEPVCDEMISVHELKEALFFQGPHELKVRPLLERYGNDLDSFKSVAQRLGGEVLDLADVAYKVWAFPKVPIYYLFWEGDQEFEPRLSILFDRSIEHHLSADAIWGLTNLVSDTMLRGIKGNDVVA